MNNTKKIILAGIAVLIITGGAMWYITVHSTKTSPSAADMNMSQEQHTNMPHLDGNPATPAATTITYDGTNFSLTQTTIASGSIVKIMNTSKDSALDFDSDPHPTHTDNPELNQGDVAPGESKIFAVTAKGTWGFHNHHDPSQHGSITVK